MAVDRSPCCARTLKFYKSRRSWTDLVIDVSCKMILLYSKADQASYELLFIQIMNDPIFKSKTAGCATSSILAIW